MKPFGETTLPDTDLDAVVAHLHVMAGNAAAQ